MATGRPPGGRSIPRSRARREPEIMRVAVRVGRLIGAIEEPATNPPRFAGDEPHNRPNLN